MLAGVGTQSTRKSIYKLESRIRKALNKGI